jgi:hypothetical protein
VDTGFQQLESLWRERMKRAYELYRERSTYADRLLTETLANMNRFSPDDVHALTEARLQTSEALKDYVRIVRLYTDLVVHGIKSKNADSPE